jgi:hypothetical protein
MLVGVSDNSTGWPWGLSVNSLACAARRQVPRIHGGSRCAQPYGVMYCNPHRFPVSEIPWDVRRISWPQ